MSTAVIFDIKRFAVHDGPGIRTTVFLKGCPLRCWWCHNPESQSKKPFTVEVERKMDGKTVVARRTYGERIGIDALMNTLLRDRHFYEESGGGITFSGGEPMMQPDALESLLKACRKHGLHTTIDTSGFARRELFERMMDHTDLFLYDLKNMDQDLHREYTGVENRLILSNADFLLRKGARVIFRIPVIPGINTSDDEMDRLVAFVEERREALEEVHLLPYHRIAENKYFKLRMKQQLPEAEEPDRDFMEQLRKKFETTSLAVTIGG
jgi:pyruvate formate lyase activating enzyme